MERTIVCTIPYNERPMEKSRTIKKRVKMHVKGIPRIIIQTSDYTLEVITPSPRRGLSDRTNQNVNNDSNQSKDINVTITLSQSIIDFVLSPCGEYIAVGDSQGLLHLFKATISSKKALFAYPIIQRKTDNQISMLHFAASAHDRQSPIYDLLVLTTRGILVRLGSLHLEEMEKELKSPQFQHQHLMDRVVVMMVNVGVQQQPHLSVMEVRD